MEFKREIKREDSYLRESKHAKEKNYHFLFDFWPHLPFFIPCNHWIHYTSNPTSFLLMNSCYNNLSSYDSIGNEENFKIGCRHSVVPSVPYKIKNLAKALEKMKNSFHRKSYFTKLFRLLPNILWKIVTFSSRNFRFHFTLRTLYVLQKHALLTIIMEGFGKWIIVGKLPKNHFMLISLEFLRITRMKQFMEFL